MFSGLFTSYLKSVWESFIKSSSRESFYWHFKELPSARMGHNLPVFLQPHEASRILCIALHSHSQKAKACHLYPIPLVESAYNIDFIDDGGWVIPLRSVTMVTATKWSATCDGEKLLCVRGVTVHVAVMEFQI